MLFFWLLVFYSTLVLAEYSTDSQCLQSESTLVVLGKDRTSGNYSVVYRLEPGEFLSLPGVQFRQLELDLDHEYNSGDTVRLRKQILATPGIITGEPSDSLVSRTLLTGENLNDLYHTLDSDELYYAWECSCHVDEFPIVYCPMDIQTCLRPFSWSGTPLPGCRNLPKAFTFRRYALLIMLIWFLALVIALGTSRLGTYSTEFLVSKCFPSWNERVIDRLIERHPQQVRDMIRQYIIREQSNRTRSRTNQEIAQLFITQGNHTTGGDGDLESIEPKLPPTILALRTKRYKMSPKIAAEESDGPRNEREEVDQCAICFLCFDDGEKVGSLKCNHLFHSDCLKMWLLRRNTCPLCQATDIAEPRYEEITSDTDGSTVPTDDNVIRSSLEEIPRI